MKRLLKNYSISMFSCLICPKILMLFAGAFLAGALAGHSVSLLRTGAMNSASEVFLPSLSSESSSWGLSFQENGQRPTGNATIEELAQYNAYYAANTDEKVSRIVAMSFCEPRS